MVTAGRARHKRLYEILRHTIAPVLQGITGFKYPAPPEINGNFLLLSNHNTDYDPILVGLSLPQHLYFVASEHVLRGGYKAWLLKKCFAPIARLKGSVASSTVMQIIRTLRAGENVCIFAEGNRSFTGKTGPILPSTGKLAKASGTQLVTYRMRGGYFTSPRWSKTVRKGRFTGAVVNVYSAEELKRMSVDEVNECIARDLYEDAYATQENERVRYKSRKGAEKLESLLFVCPNCHRVGTLKSHGSGLACSCGLGVEYDEYGFLHGTRFDTVPQWDEWQRRYFFEHSCNAPGIEFSDNDISLSYIQSNGREKALGIGTLCMDCTAITIASQRFAVRDIALMSICGSRRLVFEHKGEHYELKGRYGFNARKYLLWLNHLKGEDELSF